jgi:hypothetical protein
MEIFAPFPVFINTGFSSSNSNGASKDLGDVDLVLISSSPLNPSGGMRTVT